MLVFRSTTKIYLIDVLKYVADENNNNKKKNFSTPHSFILCSAINPKQIIRLFAKLTIE